ncbi:hypothetical protein T02_13542 [Trichinella nativa]|uniref:Uncharacterized protein n=1 Tax=Trichinella nativa TaxID=6335 RepID=A0A0V1LND7_9BILA|nr:hypothetical protein T02_13542 [Trichinella nativa]
MQIFHRGFDISSRKRFRFVNVLKSSYSRTCLPQNVISEFSNNCHSSNDEMTISLITEVFICLAKLPINFHFKKSALVK